MMNAVNIMGRLTTDPDYRKNGSYTQCRFSIAVPRDYKSSANGEYETDFFQVVAWGKKADFISLHFKKGQMIAISGVLQSGTYTAKDGTKRYSVEIIASQVYFAGSANKNTTDEAEEINSEDAENGLSNSEEYRELYQQLGDDNIYEDNLPY